MHTASLHTIRRLLGAVIASSLLALSLVTFAPARADELQDVSKLVAAGKLDDAEKRADAFLKDKPKDAQMRFLKGVIVARRGQTEAAIAIFTGLSQDYPELPEPYNNLAAVYAAQGKYEEARDALESAVRVAPGYATAYENLGDIYAALAGRAYRESGRLDPSNVAAQRKLAASRALLAGTSPPAANTSATTSAPTARSPLPSQASVGLARPAGAPAATVGVGAVAPEVVVAPNAPVMPSGSNIVAIENTAPTVGDSETTSTLATAPADPSQTIIDVNTAVQQWASANGVKVSDVKIRVDGDTASARFKQSNAKGLNTGKPIDKELVLARRAGAWVVTGERKP
jgi:hypothetical protein